MRPPIAIESRSPADTFALGERWATDAAPGWVIGLSGDLGAGKTELVKGLAKGLGVSSRVQSPTFALVNEYRGGRFPLFHLDLYRLETPEQIVRAGLEEYLFNPPGISVVEWIERWIPNPARFEEGFGGSQARFRFARIETLGETERRVIYEDSGP